jgi:hypothetical protein
MRSTRADQPVRAMKAGNAAGAKGLGQAVVFGVQLEQEETRKHDKTKNSVLRKTRHASRIGARGG